MSSAGVPEAVPPMTAPDYISAIKAAARRIEPYIRRTPILRVAAGEIGLDIPLTLKLECLQHTGSFKPRGAFNRLLSNEVPASGVLAASGGNHGVAVAYAARRLGHSAEIYVPEIASPVKIDRLRAYGADVRVTGRNYAEALVASEERVAETGALVVHAYDQPEAVAGQGTVAREFEAEAGEFDTVLVAVGGGGLIGGIAAWYGGRTRVIAVEPVLAPTLHAARGAGEPVDVEVSGIAADALGARRIGEIANAIAADHVEDVVLVEDADIRRAQRLLWEEFRILAEPAGATALSALLAGAYRPAADERVGLLVCGANTDPASVMDD